MYHESRFPSIQQHRYRELERRFKSTRWTIIHTTSNTVFCIPPDIKARTQERLSECTSCQYGGQIRYSPRATAEQSAMGDGTYQEPSPEPSSLPSLPENAERELLHQRPSGEVSKLQQHDAMPPQEKRAKEEEEAARVKEEELARDKGSGKTRKPRTKAKYALAAVSEVDECCDHRHGSSEFMVSD
ncbi:hypothetical protein MMC10_005863 [Thelotrema lepadinum]|nr:hypothetical protein [Thelotrema lepadinum]